MQYHELRAELSIQMVELEKAIDLGMPYSDLKNIYLKIKELQYQIALTEMSNRNTVKPDNLDLVIE